MEENRPGWFSNFMLLEGGLWGSAFQLCCERLLGAAQSILLFVPAYWACCHLRSGETRGWKQDPILPPPSSPPWSFQGLLGFRLRHSLKLTVLCAVNFWEVNWKVILQTNLQTRELSWEVRLPTLSLDALFSWFCIQGYALIIPLCALCNVGYLLWHM